MAYIVVDVEADGPVPGLYSMVSFGAIVVDESLDKTFYGECKPISGDWIPEALAVSGFSREETMKFNEPWDVMEDFAKWLNSLGEKRLIFWSDNNGFDWQFINYYFHRFYGSNPFGFSSQNINSFYKGQQSNVFASFKKLRKTKHDHHPVNDAKGNAEALLTIMKDVKRGKNTVGIKK